MSQNVLLLLFFAFQLLILYFVSRQTLKEMFIFLRRFLGDTSVFVLITIIFLPGTILHEFAHYLMAIILFQRVHEVSVLPEFQKNYIKLGKVIYEKKDIFRGILVGIAPIIAGLFFFWGMSIWKLFPNPNLWLTIALGYLIFVISTTMFSSKQDLVDVVYILPIFIVIAGIIYVFNINLSFITNNAMFWENVRKFILQLNIYFLFSFIIHIGIIVLLKGLQKIIK